MQNIHDRLATLRRPRLLISAARFALSDYNRTRELKRIFKAVPQGDGRALALLIDEEAHIEATRKAGDAAYSVARHVELLTAMMGEARLTQRAG
ncbi:MAG: DUF6477 family protein [Pseudomonadota bacterium]